MRLFAYSWDGGTVKSNARPHSKAYEFADLVSDEALINAKHCSKHAAPENHIPKAKSKKRSAISVRKWQLSFSSKFSGDGK